MRNPFVIPSYRTLARQHLDEARREYLVAVQNREYYEAMELMFARRVARVEAFLLAADSPPTSPPTLPRETFT